MHTSHVQIIAQQSKIATKLLASSSESQRNLALSKMADSLESVKDKILEVNAQEVLTARQNGHSDALIKRLTIDDKVFKYMISRLRKVAQSPDPLNRVISGHTNPNGLQVYKKSVPLGVIGIIYESRPNVTTDAAAVCIKSGNSIILRGGSEALQTR